jgi:hypothetical protein
VDPPPPVARLDDAERGAVFAAAFAPIDPPSTLGVRPAPSVQAQPSSQATVAPAPVPVAEPTVAIPRPSSTIKFDQFFATATPAVAAEPSAPAPAPAPMPGPTASDEDFQSWLSGLTKS